VADEKIVTDEEARTIYLEQLVAKTTGRRILRNHLQNEEKRGKELERKIQRERAWSMQLERRVERLEGLLVKMREAVPEGELRDEADDVLLGEYVDRCPTCKGVRDGDQDRMGGG